MADLCTLANLRARMGYDSTDVQDDVALQNIISAVTQAITGLTGRRFYATTETRYFQAQSAYRLDVDDLLSVTTLKTDDDANRVYETTWSTSDYDLEPVNASTDGRPYDRISVAPLGRYIFPTWRNGIQIAGSWGYTATTPDLIEEAALLASEQMFRRKDSPLGVMGSSGFLQTIKAQLENDPQIGPTLRMYRRMT